MVGNRILGPVIATDNNLADPPAQLVKIRRDAFGDMGDLGNLFSINTDDRDGFCNERR